MYFQKLMAMLPAEHKAKWLAGAALNSSDQAMLSVMSTALSRLNSFLDTEMEQMLCFGTAIDAEQFCTEKSAIFIILPEEDKSKYFMGGEPPLVIVAFCTSCKRQPVFCKSILC